MDKLSFLFLSCLYLLITLFSSTGPIDSNIQVGVAALLIGLFGIPHGAIDHVIFLEENKIKPVYFYLFYFSLMGLYTICWMMLPLISFVFFLLLSAFHFGQSQFSAATAIPSIVKTVLNFTWGCSILSGLVIYNLDEIIYMSKSSPDLSQLLITFDLNIYSVLLPLSSSLSILILLFCCFKKYLSIDFFFKEVFTLGIIHICFFIMPLIVGFTLYFVILHSIKVLKEEFSFLRNKNRCHSNKEFIQLLFPYTFVSILGCIIISYSIHIDIIEMSYTLLLLIFISSLTLPHSIVMNDFYKKIG